MSYAVQHLRETAEIVARLNPEDCERCVRELVALRARGGLAEKGSRPESGIICRGSSFAREIA
jgi:hypothetical protein